MADEADPTRQILGVVAILGLAKLANPFLAWCVNLTPS
jgi:hypothetical protein